MSMDPRQPGHPVPAPDATRVERGPAPAAPTPFGTASNSDPTLQVAVQPQMGMRAEHLIQLGQYRLVRDIGAGGMGFVYEAEDTLLHRPVALKVMRPGLPDESAMRERFLREARAAAGITHDNIVTIYGVGQDRGLTYMAMQILEGETLEERLQRDKVLPINDVIRIGKEVALGLNAANVKGLIHRDIKPANIWLESPDGRVKILDFGLARGASGEVGLTHSGMIMGTPAYMSPEQSRGETLDARSDLFSLGCIMYQMATGERPFEGPTIVSVLRNLEMHHPPSVSVKKPQVPAPLSNLIMELISKQRDQRPPNAKDVATRLAKMEPKRTGNSSARLPGLSNSPPTNPTPPPPVVPSPTYPSPRPPVAGQPLPSRAPVALPEREPKKAGFMGLLLVLLLLGGGGFAAYYFATDRGTIQIESEDTSAEIEFKQNGVHKHTALLTSREAHTVELASGDYQVALVRARPGMKLSHSTIKVERGKPLTIRIGLDPSSKKP